MVSRIKRVRIGGRSWLNTSATPRMGKAEGCEGREYRSAIKVTPFEMMYGQEAVLPVEINLSAYRVMHQDSLTAEEYKSAMMDGIDDLAESHLEALRELEKEKLMVTKAYNKKVQEKSFQVGDKVWKTVLPIGSRDNRFGKWSPS
jgi:hypothetical protein